MSSCNGVGGVGELCCDGDSDIGDIDSGVCRDDGNFQVRVEADAVGQQACLRLMEVLRSPDSSLQEQIDAVGYLQDLQYVGEEPLQACFDGQK